MTKGVGIGVVARVVKAREGTRVPGVGGGGGGGGGGGAAVGWCDAVHGVDGVDAAGSAAGDVGGGASGGGLGAGCG